MQDRDTGIGGARRSFETTQWSVILSFQGGDAGARRLALEHLVRRYWKPVYFYVRLQWKRGNEESKDLAQDFFAWLIEGDLLARIEKERGRFRSFLRVALRNFVSDDAKARRTLKRGGDRIIRIEELEEADREFAASDQDPGQAMDREWKRVLVGRALEELKAVYDRMGKETRFRIFEDQYLNPPADQTQETIAARYGMSPIDVKNALTDARSRFRQVVHDLIAETVNDEEGLRQEIRELWGREGLP